MTPKTKIAAAILVAVLGTVTSRTYAGIWVDPTSFDVNTPEGCRVTEVLTIGNDGTGDLNFMIRTRQSSTLGQGNYGASTSGQSPAFSIPAGHDFTTIAGNTSYQPGRLIVRFAKDSGGQLYTQERKNQILSSLGGASIEREFQIVPGLSVVQLPAGVTVEEALPVFNNTDGILYAEPDYEVKAVARIPNDTQFNDLWGMHNIGQSGGTVDADIDAPEAWDIGTGSSNIVVAVIDTGVDYTHPDLAANMWVNEGEIPGNGIDDDGNGYIDDVYGYDFCNNDGDPMDDYSPVYHGTHCAGTIGAVGNNNQGVVGVCWNVRIMAVKFLNSAGSGSTTNAIASVQYSVLMGAHLSSNSWGGGGYSQALKDAINAAGAAGMLFVAAAGNDSEDNDTTPHYPSCFDSASIIAVMATDKYDNRSSFSNYGPISVDLGAPGSSILSCKPGNQYQYLSGTSMATPHVAGACALLWSMNPAMGNVEIKNILLATVDPTLPGLCISEGRLNLYKAILETRAPWITIEPEEGTVGPGDSNEISVTFDATELSPGIYEAEIVIISNDPCSPTIIPVTMTVTPDDLVVSPAEGFESSGTKGGPFEPGCKVYTLTNRGTGAVNWTTTPTENWLSVEPNEGVLDPNESIEVNVCISPDANSLDPNLYTTLLIFKNADSNSAKPRSVSLTVKPTDCFTESFDSTGSDLNLLSLTFSPNGSIAYYETCREKINEFPTDPNGGTYVPLGDDDFEEVILNDGRKILFYGQYYDRFYIGSNGYITFGGGDTEFEAALENHFSMPRISALFTDLTPADNHSISYKQLEDRVAVTFKDVPIYGDKTAKNSFQIEMFFANGSICITWLKLAAAGSVAGLSEGKGLPLVLFEESDLSKYLPCWPYCDLNRDYAVNFFDYAILANHWLETGCDIPRWCERSDFDFSSTVDTNDVAIFADNWLTTNYWWLQPISHWKLDEGSGSIAYDSAGNNHGTLVNGPTWTSGQIDGALSFDGINDYVNIKNDSLIGTQSFGTVSLWVSSSLTSFSGYQGIYDESGGGTVFRIQRADNKISFGRYRQKIWKQLFSPSLTWNSTTWYHAVAVWTSSYMKLYINGNLVDSNAEIGATDEAVAHSWIGRFAQSGYYLNGVVDDVRIYDRALSAEEVLQLYQDGIGGKAFAPNPADGAADVDPNVILIWSPGKDVISHDVYLGTDYNDVNEATPDSNEYMGNHDVNSYYPGGLDPNTTYYWRIDEVNPSGTIKGDIWSFNTWINLVSWWKLDEGSGSIAYDSAGDNDGTIYGAVWTSGQINGALSFDTGDYVGCGSFTELDGATAFSMSFWIKADSLPFPPENPGYLGIIRRGSNSQRTPWIYGVAWKSYLGIYFETTTGGSGDGAGITSNLTQGQWHHIVWTWDGTTVTPYMNGVPGITDITVGSVLATADSNLEIGRIPSPYSSWDGSIDDVRIYDRALSAEEVRQLYEGGLGPKAFNPSPYDRATGVDPNVILIWSPGKDAISHDVYLGTDYNDVNEATPDSNEYMGNHDVNSYYPGGLDPNTTYFWRIDEVSGLNNITGNVWSFTTWNLFDPNLIPVSWWKFDEGSGSTVYDSAGDNDGTIYGAVWTSGQINGALSFDTGDYVGCGSFTELDGATAFSMSFWIKADSLPFPPENPGYLGIIRRGSNSLRTPWIYGVAWKSYLGIHFETTTGGFGDGAGITSNLTQGQWHHIVWTWDGTTVTPYMNGVPGTTDTTVGSILATADSNLEIGRIPSPYSSWDGSIDDVRIYDRALSAEEVLQLYEGGL